MMGCKNADWRWEVIGRWLAKFVAPLLATAALWAQIKTSLKKATYAK
jgi:hypothetical protein